MARDLNLWIGIGRFGQTPEVKYTTSGKAVCSISIACSFDDKTTWVKLVFWEKLAEIVGQYCKKGTQVQVSGRIQNRSYEKDGATIYITEIVVNNLQMLGSRDDGNSQQGPSGSGGQRNQSPAQGTNNSQAHGQSPGADDDIPF